MADQIPFDASRIEAEENLLIDFQFLIQELMVAKNITRAELSGRTGMSAARISQIFHSQANPTVKTMARIFHALGETGHLSADSRPPLEHDCPTKDNHWNFLEAADQPANRQDIEMVAMVKRSMASNDNVVYLMGLDVVSKAA